MRRFNFVTPKPGPAAKAAGRTAKTSIGKVARIKAPTFMDANQVPFGTPGPSTLEPKRKRS